VNRTGRLSTLLSVLLLLMAARTSVAHAQTHQRLWTVSGVVLVATSARLVIQTPTGGVTAALESWTRVVRAMTGSGADIRTGAHLWAHVESGTLTVNQVAVCSPGAWAPRQTSPRRAARPHLIGPGLDRFDPGQVVAAPAMFALDFSSDENNWLFGSVARAGNTSLSLDLAPGKTVSLIEAPNMTIAKYTWGNLSDLAPGEEVRATLTGQGSIHSVTIINA
jgi:hypothetical protein